jgi:tRNA threonylcarbamoyladenosine biosynthesis protein TsaB
LNYLAIDTSGDLLVFLHSNGKDYVKKLEGSQTKHSLTLMPYVEEILTEASISLGEIDFFVVVTGPGSFTGIRIGVATIKALAFAASKKVLALTSFDLIAYADNAPEKACCLVDANHENYYCAFYSGKNQENPPSFLSFEQLKERMGDFEPCSIKPTLFVSTVLCDGLSGLKNAVSAKYENAGDYNEIEPLYVKRSQAEEEAC